MIPPSSQWFTSRRRRGTQDVGEPNTLNAAGPRVTGEKRSVTAQNTQPALTQVHGPLIWKAYADDTLTVSGPSKLLLSAILLVSVLFSVAK